MVTFGSDRLTFLPWKRLSYWKGSSMEWIAMKDGASLGTFDTYRPAVECARRVGGTVINLRSCGCIYAPKAGYPKKDPNWLPLNRAAAVVRKQSSCDRHLAPSKRLRIGETV